MKPTTYADKLRVACLSKLCAVTDETTRLAPVTGSAACEWLTRIDGEDTRCGMPAKWWRDVPRGKWFLCEAHFDLLLGSHNERAQMEEMREWGKCLPPPGTFDRDAWLKYEAEMDALRMKAIEEEL